MTRARMLGASFAAALALAAATTLAAPAAPADAYYLRTSDYLHFPAWAPNGEEWHYRTVRLTEGNYLNGAYFASQFHRTDPDLVNEKFVITQSGTYRWRIHRWWDTKFDEYKVASILARGNSVVDKNINELTADGPHAYGDGWYELGGRIVWNGPLGTTEPAG